MSGASKPIILVFVGHYLPGFKSGGILRSLENTVNHLHSEFEFKVVTRDRDLGDDVPYPNIRHHEWQAVENARVYYMEQGAESVSHVRRIVHDTPHHLIYLHSFFESLTVKVLLNAKIGRIGGKPIIVAPRGEFSRAALRQKYPKKSAFMWIARLTGLYRPVIWHASSKYEAADITSIMKIPGEAIHVALDLPTIDAVGEDVAPTTVNRRPGDGLRMVFLSRIAAEKNLDFALNVLSRVHTKVTFDIIGPIENTAYWNMCQEMLRTLPTHVSARSLGSIKPSEVIKTLSQYDLLFFPSAGENYGHVIAESLTSGTQVLTSTSTPWRNLEARGLGWDLPLNDINAFVRVVDELGSSGEGACFQRRKMVKANMRQFLSNSSALAENRQLFSAALSRIESPAPGSGR